jgi:hypothetical protein
MKLLITHSSHLHIVFLSYLSYGLLVAIINHLERPKQHTCSRQVIKVTDDEPDDAVLFSGRLHERQGDLHGEVLEALGYFCLHNSEPHWRRVYGNFFAVSPRFPCN